MSLLKSFKKLNPILRVGFFTLIIKVISLSQYYLTDDAIGDVFNSLGSSLAYQVVLTSFFFGILLLLWTVAKPIRGLFKFISFIYAILAIILVQGDLVLARLTGMRFTPSIISTYGIDYIVHPDVYKALFNNPVLLVIVIIVLIGIVLLALFYGRIMNSQDTRSMSLKSLLISLGCFLLAWVGLIEYQSSYYLQSRPPELAFLNINFYRSESIFNTDQSYIKKGNELVSNFTKREVGENEEYPLYRKHEPKNDSSRYNRPDVIFLMLESLRGAELSFANAENPAHTPNMDSLARNGISFPRFMSNGYPTDDGMFSGHTSIIPHYIKKNIRDNDQTRYSTIPDLLKNQGYYTLGHWSGRPSKGMQYWYDKWYEEFHFQCDELKLDCGDIEFFKEATRLVKEHDERGADQPLFFYLQNNDTHYPFNPMANGFRTEEQKQEYLDYTKEPKRLRDRYRETLEWTDIHLKQFFDYLATRENSENTIIILMGDHGKEANEKFLAGTRLFPMNPFMHTGAVISAPEKYLRSSPKVSDFPASSVDLLPTVVSMLDLEVSYASWGKSLVDDYERSDRMSVLVRPGGIRLNWGDSSIFVNSNNPNDYWATRYDDVVNDRNDYRAPHLGQKAKKLYDLVQYGSYLTESDKLIPQELKQ